MDALSGKTVREELASLKSKGVKVRGNPEKYSENAPFHWVLSKYSECTVARITGSRIGFENIEMNPETDGDVDVLVKADHDYCIQVKTPNFFGSNYFGGQMNEDLKHLTRTMKKRSSNVAYYGNFNEWPSVRSWKVCSDTADVGYCRFHPTYFGLQRIQKKLRRDLRYKAKQLKRLKGKDCRRIVTLDTHFFHPTGDQSYYDFIRETIRKDSGLSHIDCVLILSHDFQIKGKSRPESRLIPVGNENSGRPVNAEIFADLPVQLYHARLFALPVHLRVKKGWNRLLSIKNGILIVEGTPIMKVL